MPLIACINCNPQGLSVADPECPYCNGTGRIMTDEGTAAHVAAHVAAHAPPARYPVAVAIEDGRALALANDGTLWQQFGDGDEWLQLSPLPQPEREGA